MKVVVMDASWKRMRWKNGVQKFSKKRDKSGSIKETVSKVVLILMVEEFALLVGNQTLMIKSRAEWLMDNYVRVSECFLMLLSSKLRIYWNRAILKRSFSFIDSVNYHPSLPYKHKYSNPFFSMQWKQVFMLRSILVDSSWSITRS